MKRKLFCLPLLLSAVFLAGCGTQSTKAEADPTTITVPPPSYAPEQSDPSDLYNCHPIEEPSYILNPDKMAKKPNGEIDPCQGPFIDSADVERGKAEGNVYVLYSGVMCFGGTLATREEILAMEPLPDRSKEEELAVYDSLPEVVLEQNAKNARGLFTPPQECLDAGWSYAGPI